MQDNEIIFREAEEQEKKWIAANEAVFHRSGPILLYSYDPDQYHPVGHFDYRYMDDETTACEGQER